MVVMERDGSIIGDSSLQLSGGSAGDRLVRGAPKRKETAMQPRRIIMFILSLMLLSTSALSARTAQTAPIPQAGRCFPENPSIQHCIASFRSYWEQNGGLQIFGYPVSAEQPENNPETGRTYVTQWFERNRFEAHPENQPPYDVLLGRLGAARLQQMGRNWQAEGRESGPKAGCLWFEQTGHNVCDADPNGSVAADRGFKSYWQAEGLADPRLSAYARSLALHGLPLTEARMETNSSGDHVLTQWFERARFEWHPNNPSGARVLLGLLGNELRGSPAAQALKWFWPRTAPIDVSVMSQQSWSTDAMWMLQMGVPHATDPSVTITGGVGGDAPGSAVRDVTVRGQRGTLFRSGARYAVLWSEGWVPYAIVARSEREVLDIAGGLEQIDRATWQRRAGPEPAPPPQGLKYLWPRNGLPGLSVWTGGRSYADERSFALHLAYPHAPMPDATIFGGTAVNEPQARGQSITIRGQQGTAYAAGDGSLVVWREGGHPYQISSRLELSDILRLADDLGALDLPTWMRRLYPEGQGRG